MNGPETHYTKVFSTANSEGENVLAFRFENTSYEVKNTIGSTVWLKLVRNDHMISGFYSSDGFYWTRIGEPINAADLDVEQTQFNNFTGNQQGLYVEGKPAFFDLYIYRDAYTPILAECPANQYVTSRRYTRQGYVLDKIHVNDWAMYAGVEFGNADYDKIPDSLKIIASCATTGGSVEVWIDSLETGNKIAECPIINTGGWTTFQIFTSAVEPVSGSHDVYLKFNGAETDKLFQLQWLYFKAKGDTSTSVPKQSDSTIPLYFGLEQNFPNPFNPSTLIRFKVPNKSFVSLKVYNLLGEEIGELAGREFFAGVHSVIFDASHLASGIYFYKLRAKDFLQTKKMILMK